jgi:hypothetical protein
MSSLTLEVRNPTVFIVVLASLLTSGFILYGALVPHPVPIAFADDNDKKECKKNEGDNNCNDTKKNASPELECKHQIKDNKDSTIDSECTNNSQILIDSNIRPSTDDGNVGSGRPPVITLIPKSGPPGTVVNIFGSNFDPHRVLSTFFDGNLVATTFTDNDGNFSDFFKAITPFKGPHTVTSHTQPLDSASAIFTITSGGFLFVDPPSGPAGTSVNITGIGFIPGDIISISFGDDDGIPTTPAVVEPNNNGIFTAFITIPPSIDGPNDIAAVDTDNQSFETVHETFTVTPSVTTSAPTQGMLPF